MSQWVAELREIVAEQMYLLRSAPEGGAAQWSTLSDGGARKRAYRDAESTLAFIVMREACLRAEIDGARRSPDLWADQPPDATVEQWKQRALAAEAELSRAREALALSSEREAGDVMAFAPSSPALVGFVLNGNAASADFAQSVIPASPALPDIEQKVISDVALIDSAVSLFHSILATKHADPLFRV